LGTSGRMTSRLGYGCASVMGGMSRAESLKAMEAAFDAGIRHFDTAPLYGFGESENCLGEFVARHRGAVTVTTKFGLQPPAKSALKSAVRAAARPVMRALPGLKAKLSRRAAPPAGTPVQRAPLSAAEARTSLDASLRNLGVERIDVFLLHEAEAFDANNPELLRMLEDAVTRGDIGTFGVGSERKRVEELFDVHPEFCPVVQFEWSMLAAPVPAWPAFRIHHSIMREGLPALRHVLESDAALCREWSAAVGKDLAQPGVVAQLMLAAAWVLNPQSMLLVASRNPKRIAENVAVVADASLEEPARKLHELARNAEQVRSGAVSA